MIPPRSIVEEGRAAVLGLILAVWLFTAGCASEPKSADPVTARILVGSQQALYRGELRLAEVLADSAANRRPRLADAHFQRGRVLSVMKRFDEAQHAYLKAVSLERGFHEAWINLGHNASRQLQYRAALGYYEQAADSDSAKVGVYVGRTYASLGEADSAQAAYEQALAADSANASAHLWLSLLHKDQGNLQQALHHAQEALALNRDNLDYRYVIGAQLLTMGDLDEAREHLELVARHQPWHYGAHYRLGRIMAQKGHSDEAERLMTLADSLQQLQSEAVRLEEVIRMKPEDSGAWIQLGRTLRQLGRNQDAAQAFRVAEALNASPAS